MLDFIFSFIFRLFYLMFLRKDKKKKNQNQNKVESSYMALFPSDYFAIASHVCVCVTLNSGIHFDRNTTV